MADIRVGIFAPVGAVASRVEPQSVGFVRIAESAVDHVCVGDHVSFHVGAGADALIDATSVLTTFPELPCYVALYLLPLRHPVLVARQLASIAELAPGRLTLGVGIGGEDPHELEICGVDPRTVGRRMGESLQILRALSDGTPVSFDGEFFRLHDALILPAPTEAIPIVVGGRSDAAVRRAGRFGDGWLGMGVAQPIRFGGRTSRRARCARRQGSQGL
jgi:alkanesulfonate monooxygenase SsuD/methylene tetrahydromethanopterin reductase-like flavin-dependent oxidoreductase (luciferase family)